MVCVPLCQDLGKPDLQILLLPAVNGSQDPYKPVGTEDRALSCSAGLGDQHPALHVLTPATHNLLLCSLEGLKESALKPKARMFFSQALHSLTDPYLSTIQSPRPPEA